MASTPVTIYVVVTVGLAITVDPVVVLNPIEGDQLYVKLLTELPVRVVEPPMQMGILVTFTLITGKGNTVTVILDTLLQFNPLVPVTVYTVVIVGLAVTIEPVVILNPVPGLQL